MHEGIGNLEELQTLSTVEGEVGFMKELQRLSKLKHFGISKVGAEMCKVLWESVEKMKDLEELFLTSINNKEVLNLNCISSPPLRLRFLELNCRLQQLPTWIPELQNLHGLQLRFSRLVDEPLKCLKGLPNLEYLHMYKAYDGEELLFEEGGFPKLKTLILRSLKGLKVIKFERGALPLLEELNIGPYPLMKEIPGGLQHLTKLKSLGVFDMPKEFVKALQPDGGSEYCKIQHISSVTFWYYKGKGFNYDSYKLLEEQQ